MKIKRGLKRVWISGTFVYLLLMYGISHREFGTAIWGGVVGLAIWWLLYWGVSGFFDDEKDEG